MRKKSPGVDMRGLPPANPLNEKGKRTWERPLEIPMLRPNHHVTVYFRKRGEKFAGHFHKGDDPSKNPEYFLLLRGKIQIRFQTKGGQKREVNVDASKGPAELTIQPLVLHSMRAIADCWYLEYRPRKFDPVKPDVYPPSEF